MLGILKASTRCGGWAAGPRDGEPPPARGPPPPHLEHLDIGLASFHAYPKDVLLLTAGRENLLPGYRFPQSNELIPQPGCPLELEPFRRLPHPPFELRGQSPIA